MIGKFRHSCPNCNAMRKIVFKCRKCYSLSCAECSVKGLCMDCFVGLSDLQEVQDYFELKYNEVLA